MAQYEYRSAEGRAFLVEAPMSDPPRIGHRLRRGGEVFRRVPSRGVQMSIPVAGARSAKIQGWSLPWKESMAPELQAHVDGWNEHGIPCFDSVDSAKKWCAVSRRQVDKDGQGQFYDYGDGPGGVETDAANQRHDRVKFDK